MPGMTIVDGARKPVAKHKYRKGATLTAAERQGMSRGEFALPGKGTGPKGAGAGSYPIPDEAHARAALSRGAANASPSELATIRRKVHAKFPDMQISAAKRRYAARKDQ